MPGICWYSDESVDSTKQGGTAVFWYFTVLDNRVRSIVMGGFLFTDLAMQPDTSVRRRKLAYGRHNRSIRICGASPQREAMLRACMASGAGLLTGGTTEVFGYVALRHSEKLCFEPAWRLAQACQQSPLRSRDDMWRSPTGVWRATRTRKGKLFESAYSSKR